MHIKHLQDGLTMTPSSWRNFSESSQEFACWRENASYVEPLISNLDTYTHTHTHSSTNLAMSLDFRNVSKWSALGYSNVLSWWHLRMNSNQQSRLEPTVHRVMGSPTTISHSLARVTAVLNSCGNTRGYHTYTIEQQQCIDVIILQYWLQHDIYYSINISIYHRQ